MTRVLSSIRSLPTVALALLVLVAAACEVPPQTVTDLTENSPILKVVTATSPDAAFPAGDVELSETIISGFDFGVTDGFDRGATAEEAYVPQDWGGGVWPGFSVFDGFRNSSQDSRLPALVESSAGPGGFYGIWEPGFVGAAGAWNLWGELQGLKPNTEYTVVLARMWLRVNGQLDQNQILTGQAVDQPDELDFLGGTPAGADAPVADFPALFPITADDNPVSVCWDVMDGEGGADMDCLPQAVGNSPWWRNLDGTLSADSLPFGENVPGATLEEGQYNYVLVYEGRPTQANPIPTGNPVLRVQVGPDIDQNGVVINNTFSHLPTGLTDLCCFTDLPGGASAFAAPGKVELDMTGLATLGGKQYTIWAYDRTSGSYTLAEGSEITITDGEASSTTTGASFDSPGPGATISVDVSPGSDFGAATHVVMSMEAGGAGAPSETKFMFHEYLTASKALVSGSMTLGGFNGGTGDYVFLNAGSGTVSFTSTTGTRQLQAQLRRLPQPPQGFHYASYLVELLPSTPVTQFIRANEVTLDALGNGRDVITEPQISNFAGYNTYAALLEPDDLSVLTTYYVQVSENYQFKFVDFFPR
jgi:hypothetical protein